MTDKMKIDSVVMLYGEGDNRKELKLEGFDRCKSCAEIFLLTLNFKVVEYDTFRDFKKDDPITLKFYEDNMYRYSEQLAFQELSQVETDISAGGVPYYFVQTIKHKDAR